MSELNADVVVVGSGAAGISAGLTALEGGLKVILIEKGKNYGGASLFGGLGLMAYESKHQKAAGETATVKQGFEELMTFTHHKSNGALTRAVLGLSASTIDWIEGYGIETRLVENAQESHHGRPRTYHEYVDKFAGFKAMFAHFEEKGGVFLTETAGQSLLMGEHGKITGIDAMRADGSRVKITAPVVVIASGGFGANKEELVGKLKIPERLLNYMGEKKSVGDGLHMAAAAGADMYNLDTFQLHFAVVAPEGEAFDLNAIINKKSAWSSIFWATGLPLLWVSGAGKRFVNECVVYDHALWANTVYAVGGYYYYLLDSKTVQSLKTEGTDITDSFERTIKEAQNLQLASPQAITGDVAPLPDIEDEIRHAITRQIAWTAPTLAVLADKIGVDSTTLTATVDAYNQAVDGGDDPLFYKPRNALRYAVKQGPFYAVKVRSNMLGTLGGIRVNERLEAVNQDRKPIPGLYAAGYDAGGLYGDSYPVTEGLTLGFAFNSGRIAGYSARDYLHAR